MKIIIIGGGHVGRTLAATFEDDDEAIVFLDDDLRIVERAKNGSIDAVEALVTDIELLQRDDEREVVVAAMDDDGANLLIAQLLKVRFDVDHIIVRINDPRNRSSFEDLDIETVCTTTVLADALCEAVSPHRITA